mmetsp:Transcript_45424/g.107980  ORF Transcript_45424/g.107980 Transcript_45424/m.107980 type:complete len:98 (-) Transcript_45424:769-1062(-)
MDDPVRQVGDAAWAMRDVAGGEHERRASQVNEPDIVPLWQSKGFDTQGAKPGTQRGLQVLPCGTCMPSSHPGLATCATCGALQAIGAQEKSGCDSCP